MSQPSKSAGRSIRCREFSSTCSLYWPAAVRLGRQHVRNGRATLATEKTGTTVDLPILPVLKTTPDAGPCGDLAFIVSAKGQLFTKESFGNAFAKAARIAGVKKSCHDLRNVAAIRCAENGATVPQMNAIFGWKGYKMALHYIEAANRKRLAAGDGKTERGAKILPSTQRGSAGRRAKSVGVSRRFFGDGGGVGVSLAICGLLVVSW